MYYLLIYIDNWKDTFFFSIRATAGENLYAQVWSTLPLDDLGLKTMNVLAAAGARSTVLLIHPEAGVCYQMFRTVPNKAAAVVCALLFHPKKATWLFCKLMIYLFFSIFLTRLQLLQQCIQQVRLKEMIDEFGIL